MNLLHALEEAERDLARACHKADLAYYAWKRDPNKSTAAAWDHATQAEERAHQLVWDLELALDSEAGIYA